MLEWVRGVSERGWNESGGGERERESGNRRSPAPRPIDSAIKQNT